MLKQIKKKKARKVAVRFFVFGIACISVLTITLLSISKLWNEIYLKYKEKQELNQTLIGLEEKEKELKIDVEKMQDPEYVARYLREKFFYSKNGEYIIRMPDE